MNTTIQELIEIQLIGIEYASASRRQIRALHDVKAWIFFGWARVALQKVREIDKNKREAC